MTLDPHISAMKDALCAPLLEERTVPGLVAMAENAWTLLDGALPGMPSASAWDCRPGCFHCCHAPVGVFVPEALAIGRYLSEGLEPAECQSVRRGLEEVETGLRGVPWRELLARRSRCLFLTDDGLCGIYPVRPLACRSLCSISARACEVTLKTPGDITGIPYDGPALAVAGLIVAALAFAISEQRLPLRRLELHSCVALAMGELDAGERTLAGEDVFARCVPDGAFDEARLRVFMEQFDQKLIITP